jgi:hypothetical protein
VPASAQPSLGNALRARRSRQGGPSVSGDRELSHLLDQALLAVSAAVGRVDTILAFEARALIIERMQWIEQHWDDLFVLADTERRPSLNLGVAYAACCELQSIILTATATAEARARAGLVPQLTSAGDLVAAVHQRVRDELRAAEWRRAGRGEHVHAPREGAGATRRDDVPAPRGGASRRPRTAWTKHDGP